MTLEGAQAGLSWSTILRKREGYRKAFAGFDPAAVARFRPERIARLLRNPDVVRHRGKARVGPGECARHLGLRREGEIVQQGALEVLGRAAEEERVEDVKSGARRDRRVARDEPRALNRLGFRFVGPTICYAFMQAVGMVNDHLVGCFRYRQVGR